MRVKAKIRTTDIVIAWVEVNAAGQLEDVVDVINHVDSVEAEIIEIVEE